MEILKSHKKHDFRPTKNGVTQLASMNSCYEIMLFCMNSYTRVWIHIQGYEFIPTKNGVTQLAVLKSWYYIMAFYILWNHDTKSWYEFMSWYMKIWFVSTISTSYLKMDFSWYDLTLWAVWGGNEILHYFMAWWYDEFTGWNTYVNKHNEIHIWIDNV